MRKVNYWLFLVVLSLVPAAEYGVAEGGVIKGHALTTLTVSMNTWPGCDLAMEGDSDSQLCVGAANTLPQMMYFRWAPAH